MKKLLVSLSLASLLFSSGCATVFGGKITECQRTKPDKTKNEPSRAIRVGALVADILLSPIIPLWVIIDFADCAIYKPCPPK